MSEYVKEVRKNIPCLNDKLAVDLVGNLNRSRDIIKTQQSQKFFDRLISDLNGTNKKKQTLVNESLTNSIDKTLDLVKKLTTEVNIGNKALLNVSKELNFAMSGLTDIANHSLQTRSKIDELKITVTKRFNILEEEIKRIDLEHKSRVELDRLLSSWKAGKYNDFTILGRVCLVLETLKWGSFGELLKRSSAREYNSLIEELRDKIVVQIAADVNTSPTTRLPKEIWIKNYGQENCLDTISYLYDWADFNKHPITFAVTQTEEKTPLRMPEFFNANKISDILIHENFTGYKK